MKRLVIVSFVLLAASCVFAQGFVQISFAIESGSNEKWGNYSIGQMVGRYRITDEKMVTVTISEDWSFAWDPTRSENSDNYSRSSDEEVIAGNARLGTDVANSSRTFQIRANTVTDLNNNLAQLNAEYDELFDAIDEVVKYNGKIADYYGDIDSGQCLDKAHPEYMDKLRYWKKDKYEHETQVDSLLNTLETNQGTGVPGWFSVYVPPPSN